MKQRKPKRLDPSRPENRGKCLIDTEGVTYVIDWETFPINGFVFIKCVGTDKVVKTLRSSAANRGISLAMRVGIRNGYWGVGVWRTR